MKNVNKTLIVILAALSMAACKEDTPSVLPLSNDLPSVALPSDPAAAPDGGGTTDSSGSGDQSGSPQAPAHAVEIDFQNLDQTDLVNLTAHNGSGTSMSPDNVLSVDGTGLRFQAAGGMSATAKSTFTLDTYQPYTLTMKYRMKANASLSDIVGGTGLYFFGTGGSFFVMQYMGLNGYDSHGNPTLLNKLGYNGIASPYVEGVPFDNSQDVDVTFTMQRHEDQTTDISWDFGNGNVISFAAADIPEAHDAQIVLYLSGGSNSAGTGMDQTMYSLTIDGSVNLDWDGDTSQLAGTDNL